MPGPGRIRPRSLWTALVLALQLAVCLVVLLVPLDGDPHEAPVTISGPAVVATSLADLADAGSDGLLDATAADDAGGARDDVEQGRAVAALAIDLRLDRATLYVSTAQGEALTGAVSAVVRAMAEPYAISLTTEDVAPLPEGSSGQRGLRLALGAAVLLGLGIAVLVTWWRGPVADTWSAASRRVVFAVAVGATASMVLAAVAAWQVGGSAAGWWVVLVLTALATTATTLALESVLGVAGIGVATVALVVTAAPLARLEHPLLLPEPWSSITPWLPHGAALDVARHVAWFGGGGGAQPWLVLTSWVLVPCVVLAVARRERRRAGVVWRREPSGLGRGAGRQGGQVDHDREDG